MLPGCARVCSQRHSSDAATVTMHQPHASPCIRPQQPTFHCNFQACESTCIGRQPSSHVRCHTMRAARICKRIDVFLTAKQLQVKCVTCHMSCTASRLQPWGGTYAPSLRQGHYVAKKLTLQSHRLTPSSLHCSSIPAAVQQGAAGAAIVQGASKVQQLGSPSWPAVLPSAAAAAAPWQCRHSQSARFWGLSWRHPAAHEGYGAFGRQLS